MAASPSQTDRDEFLSRYTETLPFDLYPFQEEALLAWFTSEQGVLVCAPTGMGKTAIAEAAMFEALHTGQRAYYTTPLIALTDQKFSELQRLAVSWGFTTDDVGLVTGNRRVNPDARVLVVVAEILLNRLFAKATFDFSEVAVVVMDEFHSFNDPERGIVWEMSLGLLPKHVRTLLLSATVGNAQEFRMWLDRSHGRQLAMVQSDMRRVPLTYQWVADKLLDDLVPDLAQGDEPSRFTPALLFCFNREECWTLAELLKGKKLIDASRQAMLDFELRKYNWTEGAGPKLKQILQRGVGVHHAGILGKYRRIVEHLFQEKLLSVAVCTETLAAGINLPARSVILPSLMKGPFGAKKLVDSSSAHQMFGRAGRPQFDTRGYVFAMAHEDDVKIARWRERYDQFPEDPKDPGLRRQKKEWKKKMPKRRTTEQYWTEEQFHKLVASPPGKLFSRGQLPWRVLVHVLQATSDVEQLRTLISKRLMDAPRIAVAQRQLNEMLLTLWRAGYVTLEPHPKSTEAKGEQPSSTPSAGVPEDSGPTLFGQQLTPDQSNLKPSSDGKRLTIDRTNTARTASQPNIPADPASQVNPSGQGGYQPQRATATERLATLTAFRGINPLYGAFLLNLLGIADDNEFLQLTESALELAVPVARLLRVPPRDKLPPGPLTIQHIDPRLLTLGLATEEELLGSVEDDDRFDATERKWPLTLADKTKLLFEHEFPAAGPIKIQPVWAAGELFEFGGNFNKFALAHQLQKQEGLVFRHLLRLVLLIGEFLELCPPEVDSANWTERLNSMRQRIIASCEAVDPTSTQRTLELAVP